MLSELPPTGCSLSNPVTEEALPFQVYPHFYRKLKVEVVQLQDNFPASEVLR
jgi:uncharacterized protein (DUF952 family)